jgi:hypothetical protein
MNRVTGRAALRATVFAAGLVVAACGGLAAQGGDGYRFGSPAVTLKFEAGYGRQRAGSEIFDWVVQEHTVSRRAFDAPYVGGELAVAVHEHADIALSLGFQSSTVQSEYRDWVDSDDRPILQTTSLQRIPFTASVRVYPLPRGRQIGRFAWIPRTVTPFFGAGLGLVSWDFAQEGDFIDYDTLDIYRDQVLSESSAFLARAFAGLEVAIGNNLVLTAEGRYSWADDPMEGGFVGFDNIDLDGLALTGGIAIRF